MTGLLALLQLADSSFPTGGYTLSHGFEAIIADARRIESDPLADLVADFLEGVAAPGDATALAAAWNAAENDDFAELCAIDTLLTATRLAAGARAASIRCGRQLISLARSLPARTIRRPTMLDTLARRVRRSEIDANHAVAFGAIAYLWGIERGPAIRGYLHATALSVLTACLRLGAVDHVEVQRSLIRLESAVETAAAAAESTPWRGMYAGAPYLEVMAMRQARLPVRLFAT